MSTSGRLRVFGACMLAAALTSGCADTTQPTSCQYVVNPTALTPCMRAASLTTSVTTATGCGWTAASQSSWISVTGTASGTGSGTVAITVTDNYDAPRSGSFSIRGTGSPSGQSVTVSQAGCYYAVTRTSFSFTAAGGSDSFDVVQQSDPNTCGGATQDACMWTAQSDSPLWLVVTSSMPRFGDQPVGFTVSRNTTGAARSGTITVRDKVVQITQAAR